MEALSFKWLFGLLDWFHLWDKVVALTWASIAQPDASVTFSVEEACPVSKYCHIPVVSSCSISVVLKVAPTTLWGALGSLRWALQSTWRIGGIGTDLGDPGDYDISVQRNWGKIRHPGVSYPLLLTEMEPDVRNLIALHQAHPSHCLNYIWDIYTSFKVCVPSAGFLILVNRKSLLRKKLLLSIRLWMIERAHWDSLRWWKGAVV